VLVGGGRWAPAPPQAITARDSQGTHPAHSRIVPFATAVCVAEKWCALRLLQSSPGSYTVGVRVMTRLPWPFLCSISPSSPIVEPCSAGIAVIVAINDASALRFNLVKG